ILAEVEGVQKKIAAWEDEELEIMQATDDKEKEIPGLQKIFQEDEAEFKTYKAKKDAEQARIEGELNALNAQRQELLQSIESKLSKRYEKLIQYHGDFAVVALDGDACMGCHQLVLPQTAVEVRKGETVFECNHCNRILYAQPEPEPQSSAETAAPK
ncbi:MAG: zinc ribbon domain-containing protein, partial [Nitrospinales bacterium]